MHNFRPFFSIFLTVPNTTRSKKQHTEAFNKILVKFGEKYFNIDHRSYDETEAGNAGKGG